MDKFVQRITNVDVFWGQTRIASPIKVKFDQRKPPCILFLTANFSSVGAGVLITFKTVTIYTILTKYGYRGLLVDCIACILLAVHKNDSQTVCDFGYVAAVSEIFLQT